MDSDLDSNSDSEKEWIVEKIISKRIKDDQTVEYLLKWEGFSPAYNSWVPEGDLECYELLWEFEQENEKKERKQLLAELGSAEDDDLIVIEDDVEKQEPKRQEIIYLEEKEEKHDEKVSITSGSSRVDKNNNGPNHENNEEQIIETLTGCINEVSVTTKTKINKKIGVTEEELMSHITNDRNKSGLELGLVPEAIVGVTPMLNGIHFLVRFQNNDMELISSKIARKYCPSLVIDYYESHIDWS